jgi:predicted glycoside hydrolase/deacetylase ChbG (UPF0249 family)
VFLRKYYLNKLDFTELEEELDLQVKAFLTHFNEIPFINGTQHMHMMPKVWNIVLKLAKMYKIRAIRLPGINKPSKLMLNKRLPFLIPFRYLGERGRKDCRRNGIKYPKDVQGMQYSGKINEKRLIYLLDNLSSETTELVMHPGYESKTLRADLPWAYSTFDWDRERIALQSGKIKKFIENKNINLIKFSEL